MFRTNTNAPESEGNDQEHSEEVSSEVQHHSPDLPQPQQVEIVSQKSDIPSKNIDQQKVVRKPRKLKADITRRSDRIAAKAKSVEK